MVGWNEVSRGLIGLQLGGLLATIAGFRVTGLSLEWSTVLPWIAADCALLVLWASMAARPGKPSEWVHSEAVMVLVLTITATHILGPAQYAAAALGRPLIDPLLARGDALLSIDVAMLASWTGQRPLLNTVLNIAYFTLLPQFAFAIIFLGVFARDRRGLWEFCVLFQLCAAVTVLALAIWPAECAFQYLDFRSTINQDRFIAHFNGVRDGTLTLIRFDDIEGLISMPSFHVAGALLVTWSCRRHTLVFYSLAAVNVLLIAATVLTGAHYAIDVLVTFIMFGCLAWASAKALDRVNITLPSS